MAGEFSGDAIWLLDLEGKVQRTIRNVDFRKKETYSTVYWWPDQMRMVTNNPSYQRPTPEDGGGGQVSEEPQRSQQAGGRGDA